MTLCTSFQNKIDEGYLSNLGTKICSLYNTLIDIKNGFNFISKEQNMHSINYTFSISYQSNIENSKKPRIS